MQQNIFRVFIFHFRFLEKRGMFGMVFDIFGVFCTTSFYILNIGFGLFNFSVYGNILKKTIFIHFSKKNVTKCTRSVNNSRTICFWIFWGFLGS